MMKSSGLCFLLKSVLWIRKTIVFRGKEFFSFLIFAWIICFNIVIRFSLYLLFLLPYLWRFFFFKLVMSGRLVMGLLKHLWNLFILSYSCIFFLFRRELMFLFVCVLLKVRLVDASFVWTEPHSKRLKVKLTIQKEISYT